MYSSKQILKTLSNISGYNIKEISIKVDKKDFELLYENYIKSNFKIKPILYTINKELIGFNLEDKILISY